MLNFLGGAASVAAGLTLISYCRARDGKLHWLVRLPGMEMTISLTVVCLLAAGIAVIMSSFLE